MNRTSVSVLTLALLVIAVPATPANAQVKVGSKTITACELLTAAEIRTITGRSDLATARPMREDQQFHTNCIHSGAPHSGVVDIGITVAPETNVMFGRVRDNYGKAPARLGYRVEKISGLGDDAYYLIDKTRVQLMAIAHGTQLTVSLGEVNPGSKLPPEAEAKAIALKLAKAGLAKLR
jgi:hypothetical protein